MKHTKHTIIQVILTIIVIAVAVTSSFTYTSMYHDVSQLKSELEEVRSELETQNGRIDSTVDDVQFRVEETVSQVQKSQEELQHNLEQQSSELTSLSGRVDSGQIINNVLPSVVQIEIDGTIEGTGFLIGNTIITNQHVVRSESTVSILNHEGMRYSAYVTKVDGTKDLATLRPTTFRADGLQFSTNYRTGQRIYVVGSPAGLDGLTVTEGIISNAHAIDNGRERIQISAEINHGNSGGPVIDEYGNVIGVVQKRLFSYDGISYAIPAVEAQSILG